MKITVVTTMRNEGPHLLEWIAHHRAIGVSDFVIYTNDCDDGTDALLDLLDVVHIRQTAPEKPQWQALRDAWDVPQVKSADWLACIDCDEFINLSNGIDDLPTLIDQCDADAILLPWRLFGHSGHATLLDEPTTQRFTYAAPADMIFPPLGSYFKTLFRREGPFQKFGVHRPKQKKDARPIWVDGSGNGLTGRLHEDDGQIMHWVQPIARDLVQLNHYSVRSAADFMLKRVRGLPNHRSKPVDLTYWVERNFNVVEEPSIAHMWPGTQAALQELRDLPDVADTQEACIMWHHQKLAELLREPEELKLYGRLILSQSSMPPDAKLGLDLIKLYQAAYAG